MNELIFSLNTVLPLVLLVVIGFFIKKINLLKDEFYPAAEKFVFRVALPCSLFLSVSGADPSTAFSVRLILFCVIGTIVAALVIGALTVIFIKSNAERGAFIQGGYRSNFALLGSALADRLFPVSGLAAASALMPFTIPLFNVIAVATFSLFAPAEKKQTPTEILKKTLRGIVTNPLIIGIALAVPFMLLRISLPGIVTGTLKYVGSIASPLALICIGASLGSGFEVAKLRKALFCSLIKTALLPAAAVAVAILLGMRDVELGLVLILFGSPTAVSSYIMAKNMDSDEKLAAQILMISTVLCAFTLFVGIYILTSFNLIPMT